MPLDGVVQLSEDSLFIENIYNSFNHFDSN